MHGLGFLSGLGTDINLEGLFGDLMIITIHTLVLGFRLRLPPFRARLDLASIPPRPRSDPVVGFSILMLIYFGVHSKVCTS